MKKTVVEFGSVEELIKDQETQNFMDMIAQEMHRIYVREIYKSIQEAMSTLWHSEEIHKALCEETCKKFIAKFTQ